MLIEVDIDKVVSNEKNPRFISPEKLEEVRNSVEEFKKMLKIRPIVVNENMLILGGNQRYRVCKELGFQKVWVYKEDNFSQKEQEEFIIKDNITSGSWDYDILQTDFDVQEVVKWGIDSFHFESKMMDTFFGEDEETGNTIQEAELKPKISDDGYVKFEIIIKEEEKHNLIKAINKVKQEQGLSSGDSVVYIFRKFAEQELITQ
tara:strand:+ start:494 stop:1105 length:612 start_codon:yes stop_codon:yes gene_type:complete